MPYSNATKCYFSVYYVETNQIISISILIAIYMEEMCLLANLYIKPIVSPGNAHVLQNLPYDIKLDIARRSNVFKCPHLCSQLPAQGQSNNFPEKN